MKYLQGSFNSAATNDNYRDHFEDNFAGEQPLGSSLTQCPACKTYYRKGAACPKGCDKDKDDIMFVKIHSDHVITDAFTGAPSLDPQELLNDLRVPSEYLDKK